LRQMVQPFPETLKEMLHQATHSGSFKKGEKFLALRSSRVGQMTERFRRMRTWDGMEKKAVLVEERFFTQTSFI
jgi:hypothetical protein